MRWLAAQKHAHQMSRLYLARKLRRYVVMEREARCILRGLPTSDGHNGFAGREARVSMSLVKRDYGVCA